MFLNGENGELVVQFGTGDVGVAAGFVPNKEPYVVGSVSFYPQKARPINSELPEFDLNNCVRDTDLSDIPLRFVFTDAKSIDVVMPKGKKT